MRSWDRTRHRHGTGRGPKGAQSGEAARQLMPCHTSCECLGKGPIKNTLQHVHEIREGSQSRSDEITMSNGSSDLCQPRLQENQSEPYTSVHWPVGRGQGEVAGLLQSVYRIPSKVNLRASQVVNQPFPNGAAVITGLG
ncbi:hypothetical protein EYF80_039955 [Liparis tanakae]|uniref:Uncharacterized protein n=1 Tax=Liparis tanakae TaxID=230148 RepID=A0A4Z2GB52_9TELE|nr:hypothetical protein EYF80_039955 [Liparis tanakae]